MKLSLSDIFLCDVAVNSESTYWSQKLLCELRLTDDLVYLVKHQIQGQKVCNSSVVAKYE